MGVPRAGLPIDTVLGGGKNVAASECSYSYTAALTGANVSIDFAVSAGYGMLPLLPVMGNRSLTLVPYCYEETGSH